MTKQKNKKSIQVCAHWQGLAEPALMGTIYATPIRGKEVFSFEYTPTWLKSPYAQTLDPDLGLFSGAQYTRDDKDNFGLFLDSSPDRWGRLLMQRREAQQARTEKREVRPLLESDYLLGVYDGHRMGALRFRLGDDQPFLDDKTSMASPPWVRLRELEDASLQLENDNAEKNKNYSKWLNMLIAPGGSLGGARPKAGVVDEDGGLWIAKFPSKRDETNIGAWEFIVHQLAHKAGVDVSSAKIQRFSGTHDTFLTRRFDRSDAGERIHFASAMTLLGKKDGEEGSYLDIAEFIIRGGAKVSQDLEQLWRRIVFNICVSNTDDHLRNHGFLLTSKGWILSPAYDMNPVPTGDGLVLNISKNDNAQSLELALSVAPYFRLKKTRAEAIISEVRKAVKPWQKLAKKIGLPERETATIRRAFRAVE